MNGFKIEKNNWKNSIDIVLPNNTDFNITNLFKILNFYMKNQSLNLSKIYLISKNNEDINIYENINLNLLESLSLHDFFKWFDEIVNENWKYVSNKEFIGFRLIFLNDWKFDNEVFPKFFTSNDELKYVFEKNIKIQNIRYLNKKIRLLERKLKYSLYNKRNKQFRHRNFYWK